MAVQRMATPKMAAPPVYRPNLAPQIQRMAAPKVYIPNMASPVQLKIGAIPSLVRTASVPQPIPPATPIHLFNQSAQLKPGRPFMTAPPPALALRAASRSIQPRLSQQARLTGNTSHSKSVVQPSFGQYKQILHEKGQLSNKRDKRLREGQEAISKTRAKLGAGAGNIKEQVAKSSGVSFVTTNYVKKTGQQYTSQGINFLEAWAIAARRGSAGNCDEFAAVTYFYLLAMNTGDSISVVGLPDVHHHFVMIGDVNNPSGDDAVVVDPWPAKGYAVLYDHWQYKGEKMAVTLGPTTSTGQTPLKDARKTLNSAGHTRGSFARGLKEEFGHYESGEKMREGIRGVHQAGGYFWGNRHTVKETIRQGLKAEFARRRAAVTDPLGLSQEEFNLLY